MPGRWRNSPRNGLNAAWLTSPQNAEPTEETRTPTLQITSDRRIGESLFDIDHNIELIGDRRNCFFEGAVNSLIFGRAVAARAEQRGVRPR